MLSVVFTVVVILWPRAHTQSTRRGKRGARGGAVVAVISAGLWVSSMRPRSRSHAAHSDWIRMHCLYITPTATQAGRGEGCAPQPWVLGSKAFCRHRPPQERCHIHHPRASSVSGGEEWARERREKVQRISSQTDRSSVCIKSMSGETRMNCSHHKRVRGQAATACGRRRRRGAGTGPASAITEWI